MVQRYLKLKPLPAIRAIVSETNPLLADKNYTITNITDLGAAANPNTSATITGDGVGVVGTTQIAFSRMNPAATFSKYRGTIKRPAVQVRTASGQAASVPLATIADDINRSIGLDIDTVSAFKDVDGTQLVNLPALGNYVDCDITVNQANSLRFRPSATDKLPLRFINAGQNWPAALPKNDCRHSVPIVPDEFEKGLIVYMPLGEDGGSAFRGQSSSVTFNTAAAYTMSGKAVANASNTTLSQSEVTKKVTAVLHMPLAGNLTDQVSGAVQPSQGTITWPAAGRNGVSMLATSTNARINPTNAVAIRQLLSGSNDWTIAFDFYGVSTNYWQQILGCYAGGATSSADGIAVMFYKGQLYTYAVGGSTLLNSVSVTGLADGKWHKIEVNRSAGKLRLFVDGVKVSENTLTTNINLATTPFQIGNSNGLGNPCQSYIRSLEIHNIALHTENHVPEWWWADAANTTNVVTMLGKELNSSTWKQIWSAVPTVTESVAGYLKWLLIVDGKYCSWDAAMQELTLSSIDNILTEGLTTAQLRTAMTELPLKGYGTLGFAVALVTNGTGAPAITSMALNTVVSAGVCPTVGWTLPVPNSTCKLRGNKGTLFSFGGYNLGRDLTNSKTDLDTALQGTSEFTIELDIQRNTLTPGVSDHDSLLWNCYDATSQTEGLFFGIYQDGRVLFGQFDTALTYRGSASVTKILDYLPHRIALVKKSNVLSCYIDGALDGTLTMPTAGLLGTAAFRVGFGRTIHGNTNVLTRPFRGYMRDFKIYNYAKYTASHEVNHVRPLAPSNIMLNGDALAGTLIKSPTLQSLLYGVDFTEVFESVGLSNIIAASDATVLRGDIVTAINAKLTSLGIQATLLASATVMNTTVSKLYAVPPTSASGHNPASAAVVVIDGASFAPSGVLNIAGPVTLHLMSIPAA